MGRRNLVTLAALAVLTGGCTAFVLSQLPGDAGTSTQSGGCFALPDNQCSQCIVANCEQPTASPPVSLAKVCSLDQNSYSSVVEAVTACAEDPTVANNSCEELFVDGGTYAATIDTQAAAESNLLHCITDHCVTSCSECGVETPSCGNDTVPLADAGACGACLDDAMNRPGSACQSWVLAGGCYSYVGGPIATCAVPSGSCNTPDCSGLSAPSTDDNDAGYGLDDCLWQQCGAVCPNP